jgi:hypothetical protein
MQSRLIKILFILLGIIIVCAVGFWIWDWATSSTPASPAQTVTSNGTQFPSQVSVGVSSSSQSQTQTTAPASQPASGIDSAYATLFAQFGGGGATFVRADASSTGDLGSIYALYAKDAGISEKVSPGAPDYFLDVALTDLNGDGTNEAIVFEDSPGLCGTGGCELDIYQKKGTAWNKVFTGLVQGDVGLSNVYVNGYQELYLTVDNGSPYSEVARYDWNGTTYAAKALAAAWNGSSFQIMQ